MKRGFDIIVSLIGLVIFSPILLITMLFIWLYDFHTPFYVAKRVGKDGKIFRMIKFRSMIVNADKTGVVSTSSNDTRLTPIGRFIRKYKIDEIVQLLNVLKGDMSFVGPRPNVLEEVKLYTKEEIKILCIRPGITDISSIVFSDLNEILKDKKDLNLAYNQLIRPWKSRLGILYVEKKSFLLDIQLIVLTILGIFNRNKTLKKLNVILKEITEDKLLISVSLRDKPLYPFPPPGLPDVVLER